MALLLPLQLPLGALAPGDLGGPWLLTTRWGHPLSGFPRAGGSSSEVIVRLSGWCSDSLLIPEQPRSQGQKCVICRPGALGSLIPLGTPQGRAPEGGPESVR